MYLIYGAAPPRLAPLPSDFSFVQNVLATRFFFLSKHGSYCCRYVLSSCLLFRIVERPFVPTPSSTFVLFV